MLTLPAQVLAAAAKPMKVVGGETEEKMALSADVPPVRWATAESE